MKYPLRYSLSKIQYTDKQLYSCLSVAKSAKSLPPDKKTIHQNRHLASEAELQDLSIIFYLQNIESVEMASFQILQMAAVKLHNSHINKLLKENYEEAKSDRVLLLLISSKYIVS